MKSKGFKRFEDRLRYFRMDVEVADAVFKNKELLKGDDKIFKNINNNEHPLLCDRSNTAGSRNIVTKHLRATIHVAFIKEL